MDNYGMRCLRLHLIVIFCTAGPVEHGRLPEPGPRHRGVGEALEEVRGERVPGEGEVPAGVEEQVVTAEALHDARSQTRPHVLRCHVSEGFPFWRERKRR